MKEKKILNKKVSSNKGRSLEAYRCVCSTCSCSECPTNQPHLAAGRTDSFVSSASGGLPQANLWHQEVR